MYIKIISYPLIKELQRIPLASNFLLLYFSGICNGFFCSFRWLGPSLVVCGFDAVQPSWKTNH